MHRAKERQGAAILGVLNVTPDSFFDGGRHATADRAKRRIDEMLAQGADAIDVGAESTRPGARGVPGPEQIDRAGPALEYAVAQGAVVSIDTTSVQVAEAALRMGVQVINDVSCLTDSVLAELAVRYRADLIIMHSQGSMTDMPGYSEYDADAYGDVVDDVCVTWQAARERALSAGMKPEHIWFDPGIGFHKNAAQSTMIFNRLEEFRRLGAPMVVGPSRKSFLGQWDGSGPDARLGATIAACLRAVDAGAKVLRVHDVLEVRQALLAHRALGASGRVQSGAADDVAPARKAGRG